MRHRPVARRSRTAALTLGALLGSAACVADGPRGPHRVLAVYYGGYSNPLASGGYGRWACAEHDPSRLNSLGYPDSATLHHPRLGMYDSRNPIIVAEHVRQAVSAGISGFVVPWRGDDRGAAEVLDALWRAAPAHGLEVTVRYDGAADVVPRRVAEDIGRLLQDHPREAGAWVRSASAPVVFLSRSVVERLGVRGVQQVRERLRASGRAVWLVGGRSSGLALAAFGVDEGAPQPSPFGRYVRLCPWYISGDVGPGTCAVVRSGVGGRFYEDQWIAALSGDPDWVLVDSWNGWREGTEIEPSLEDGDKYLRLTRQYAEAFQEGRYLSVEPCSVFTSVGEETEVRVTARNHGSDGRRGWVSLRAVGAERFAPHVSPSTVSLVLPPRSERTAKFTLKVTDVRQLGPVTMRARARFGAQEPVEARLAVDFRRPYDVRLVPVAAPWFADAEGPTVVVTNRRHVKARCEVTLVASDWPPERQSVTLAGRAEQEVMFSQPGGLGAPMPRRLQVGVVGGGREFWTDLPVDWAAAPRLSRAVVVDGDLSDWPFRADFHLTEEHQVVDVRGWSRHDLSAVACTAWDDDFLYLGVEVTDDEHVQMETGELIWTGDSVQFAIDALGNGGHAYDDDDYEYGLALTPGGPVIWRWHGAEYRHVGEVAFGDLAVRRGDCGTVYEMALPWRELTPLEPKRDATFGFTLAVNDADESRQGKNVREGAIQFTPGIIHEKDPSKFARWRLIGALDGDGG